MDLAKDLGNYAIFYGKNFINDTITVYDDFIDHFLLTQAYIGEKEGLRIPSFDPFHVAYSEAQVDKELGQMKQWLAYYSNCFILYVEYPDNPDQDDLIFCIDKTTYEQVVQYKES